MHCLLLERENNVIYQVAAPGAATYKDYAIDANGDLKTPSYIPLTGTEEGKPLTKNIEIDLSEEVSVGFISNTPGLSKAVIAIEENNSVFIESHKETEDISSSIHLHHDTGVEISATVSDEQFSAIVDVSGLKGNGYTTPTTDEHYVQKKYITDNFTSQTTLDNTLANYYTKPETYSKTEIDAKFSAVYRPKGSVANFASLPSSGNTEGDVWNIIDSGSNYVWVTNLNSTEVAGWDKLSETIDLTAYYTQSQIDSTLNNYVTKDTGQNITGQKQFITNGGSEIWNNNGLILLGLGDKMASMTFYSSGFDIGQLMFNGNFNFLNQDATGFKNVVALGYNKAGSSDSYILTGGGGQKAVSDFALTTDLNNYWQRFNDANWNNIRSDKPFAILNATGNTEQNLYAGGLLTSNDYGDASLIPTNGIYSKGNIATLNYGSAIDWAIASAWVSTYGNLVHKIDRAGLINNGSNSRPNQTWFDYNWADSGLAGSVINFSGLTDGYSTELFSDYSSGTAIGVRTSNGDSGVWNPVRYLWHSGNFDPSNYPTSVDLANNYIPLGGTQTGLSLTGMIETNPTSNGGFISRTSSVERKFELSNDNNSMLIRSVTPDLLRTSTIRNTFDFTDITVENNEVGNTGSFIVNPTTIDLRVMDNLTPVASYISISADKIEMSNDVYNTDYIIPINDNYYVQKKYVDDLVGEDGGTWVFPT